jgi:hypothetical protein
MSRTFRRDESGRKAQDTRRAKKREKSNSHWSLEAAHAEEYRKNKNNKNYRHFELDTDLD